MPPPPVPSTKRSLFEQCARASWLSVVIAIASNFAFKTSGTSAGERPAQIIHAVLVFVLALVGVIGGIVALCGVRRHGRKGLLWPAITGISIWVLLVVLAFPVFLMVRKKALLAKLQTLTPAIHAPGATKAEDAELGYSFDVPEGYLPFSAETRPAEYRQAYLREDPGHINRVLLVKPLGGRLPPGRLKPENLPQDRSLSLLTFQWRGLTVDGIRVPEKVGESDYVTINVQIPLRKQAIQLGFGGSAESETQVRALVETVLSSLEEKTAP